MPEEKGPLTAQLFLSLCLNIVSSVGIVFINKKLVYNLAQFHFGTALTIIHFVVCFAGCLGFAKLKFFEIKRIPIVRVLSISAAFSGYVVFNNMSLLYNSVAFYQIMKILCTPVIVAIERVFYDKYFSKATLVALIPVCLGIFITVYGDMTLTFSGILWAVLAVGANSLYTIWGNKRMKELEVSAMQILTYNAPTSAVMLLFCLPLMDDWHALIEYQWTGYRCFCIFLSCLFAFGVNFSFFLFVGQTSSLTMNVVGYVKTVLIFVGGFIFVGDEASFQILSGIALTLLGVALYTKSTMPKPAAQVPPSSPTTNDGRDGSSVPQVVGHQSLTPVASSNNLDAQGQSQRSQNNRVL